MKFHVFFGIDFCIDFRMDFEWILDQNGSKKHAFWFPFRDLFRASIFGCILVAIWHPLGSILAPFDTFWVNFGPSWHPLGSILVALGTILAPFSTSGRHFGKKSIFGHPISRKTCKLPLATPTKANFRMNLTSPRPGAGILPQATEIRSGPGFTPPEGVLALSHCFAHHLALHLSSAGNLSSEGFAIRFVFFLEGYLLEG